MPHRSPTSPHVPKPVRALAATAMAAAMTVALAACGGAGNDTPPATSASAPSTSPPPASAQQAEARVGDATVYMTAIATSNIPAEVAQEHGIERRDDLIQLRVSARQGEAASAQTAQVTVQGTVSGLHGNARPLEFKEMVANDLVDHVATFEIDPPDTLTFEVRVSTPSGANETLRLTREFLPQ